MQRYQRIVRLSINVSLDPGVVDLLTRRRAQARNSEPEDYIFEQRPAPPWTNRHIGTAFRLAVTRAELAGSAGRLSAHSLRHGYASTLISQGLNVV